MKKILFMVYSMRLGGVEKSLVDLLNLLCYNKDLDITLLLLEKEGEFLECIPKSVKIKTCKFPYDIYLETTKTTKEGILDALQKAKVWVALKVLVDCLRHKGNDQQEVLQDNYHRWLKRLSYEKEQYDIAVDYQGMVFFPTFYIAEFVNAKTKCTWIHNDVSAMPGDMTWQKEYYDCYDKVFCVSKQAMIETAKRMPFVSEKVDTFYNIIPVDEIIQKSQESCEELQGKCKILTIGRLSPLKGYDIAFRAIARLCEAGYDVDYYIVGEGEQRSELEKLINELGMRSKIHLLGYQSNPYKFLKQCDIYFQPSRFEGFCITLGEAKIFNKPIVTTDFAGAREQIENNNTGIIIQFNEEEMCNGLLKMIESPTIRKTYADALTEMNMQGANDVWKLLKMLE